MADKDAFLGFSTTSHSVWGRVVPDCRDLVAALAEE
jgi:hypothetical protein